MTDPISEFFDTCEDDARTHMRGDELAATLLDIKQAREAYEQLIKDHIYTLRLASHWLGGRTDDADNATHAKRVLENAIHAHKEKHGPQS